MIEGEPAAIGAEAAPFLRFRAAHGWAGSQPVVGLVPEAALGDVLPRETVTDAFGRVALYEDGAGRLWLGTWGRRRVARFLALLRARGLVLQVVDTPAPPAGLRQRWRSVSHAAAEAAAPRRAWWAMLDELNALPPRPARGAEASPGPA